jgi:site-specific DNA-methyltransferase (adenine-specific)
MTITSPPYNIGLKYDTYEDNISSSEYTNFAYDWMSSVYTATKETGRLYCVLDDKLIWKLKPIAEEIGWKYVQLLTWCKQNFAGRSKSGGRRINGDWNFMNEYVLLFRKGKRNMMLANEITTTHSWFKETVPQTNFKKDYLQKVHPAQMPVNLVRKWIARTPGQVVLDPFCGAGSVCIAARDMGRDYIGIDLSEEYCRLARERLDS